MTEAAMADTPKIGAMDFAASKPAIKVKAMIQPPTTMAPDSIPAQAPAFVIRFEYKPQRKGPIKEPATTPHEKDMRLTINEMFAVANKKEHAMKTRHKSLIRTTWFFGLI